MDQTLNVPRPLFGRAGVAPVSETSWNEIDNLDVELLAEYLLDDNAMLPNSAIANMDFGMGDNQAMISPENSVDGSAPPAPAPTSVPELPIQAAAPPQQLVTTTPNNPLIQMQPQMVPQQLQTMTAFPTLPAQIGMHSGMQPQNGAVIFQQQEDPATKRRRLEQGAAAPIMAVAAPGAAALISTQQLAVAAAEAMQQGRGRKKSQAQINRRRERNRILARRTRLRKKFFFESLQKEVMDLQRENQMLKGLVETEIGGDSAKQILDECDAQEKLPPAVIEACGEHLEEMEAQDASLVKSIQQSQHSFVITDPSLADNPIVFASDDFLKLTGYKREEVLGRNCRFLQGTDTSKDKIELVRKAVASGEDVTVTMINYMSDGTPFWNKLFIAALRDAQNNIVNYIGVIVKVASPEPGDPEYGQAAKALGIEDGTGDFDDEDDAEGAMKAIDGAVPTAVGPIS